MTAALESYLSAILEIGETLDAVAPEIAGAFRERLLTLRARLSANHSEEALEQSRAALREILQSFRDKARQQKEALARDLSQTLTMVTRTEDLSAGRNVQYVVRLADFVDRIDSAIQSGDLRRLATHASALREFSQSIELDSRENFASLRQKMIEIQRRLREVELLARLDPLTGVSNRRDLDRELAARIEVGQDFCLLLFDLNGFKSINDRYGHLCGDEVLMQLAARLTSQVRTHDYVCRWGGDEFVAILACDLAVAESRARQIADHLNGAYHIVADEREVRVDITVTVGLAQYWTGESPEQLFRRVDQSMYRRKHETFNKSSWAG